MIPLQQRISEYLTFSTCMVLSPIIINMGVILQYFATEVSAAKLRQFNNLVVIIGYPIVAS